MDKQVKTRIAPSPSGNLHIGTARAALFNYLFSKKHGGEFILRIEDTDLERSDKKFEEDILTGLQWLGLEWDKGPLRQSERTEIYTRYINQLLESKKAFHCYHSQIELDEERQQQMRDKDAVRHVCEYKHSLEKREGQSIIRLAVDENSKRKVEFNDLIRGEIEIEERLLGDLSIAKDENTPLYNFAVVVDDYDMEITHVIRGEDHISNTPKQILIQEALDFPRPEYGHLPLILAPDKSKLSKRHGAVSILEYKEEGYLPEAMVNYMAMLGLTLPGDEEIMSLYQLADFFDIENVHKSGAVFDTKKLDWVNSQYLNKLDDEELEKMFRDYMGKEYNDAIGKSISMIKERLNKLKDIEEFKFLYEDTDYDKELLIWKKHTLKESRNSLTHSKELIEETDLTDLREGLESLATEKFGGDRGSVYWPLRVALSGKKGSPDPVDIANAIGKKKTLERIQRAIEKL